MRLEPVRWLVNGDNRWLINADNRFNYKANCVACKCRLPSGLNMVITDTWPEATSWREAIDWGQSAQGLTTPIECHGIRDRLEDDGGRPAGTPVKRELTTYPAWRYEGFYGQIRVTLESGEDWFVTVLAPLHFLRHLVRSAQ